MSMKLFLVRAAVEGTLYTENTGREDIRCVWVENAKDAESMYLDFVEAQEARYSVPYAVTRLTVTEALGTPISVWMRT